MHSPLVPVQHSSIRRRRFLLAALSLITLASAACCLASPTMLRAATTKVIHRAAIRSAAAAALPLSSRAVAVATGVSATSSSIHTSNLRSGREMKGVTQTRASSHRTSQILSGVRSYASSAAVEEVVAKPVEKFRKDYQPPPYWIRNVELDIRVYEGKTTVISKLTVERDPSTEEGTPMVLDGEDLKLNFIKIDGEEFKDYEEKDKQLTLGRSSQLGAKFVLETSVDIVPEDNTQLSGLYKSGSMYCTQCEAEGFRRITYHLDRPDNMATYKVRVEADKKWPVLLSNGNLIKEGEAEDGRHYALFEDPYPKPSYLFAVVVGDLGKITDSFTTMSGRKVQLNVFSEPENVDALSHAMESLKKSMKWDEERFGREYDLDVYHIVAVNDFNMGAMENKGLNVFNTALTLAKPDTATDTDYMRIEGVIGHEYFHNWSGNRVTCRDWFQLTLKEGLTVFRDQEFSADMWSHAVKRIEEVRGLRGRQFQEDAGPMSHPIRPESYIAMDNFYTATVYTKGAEVIRMYYTLLGPELFRKGMDLYFNRHDGQAVTCDDFRQAMSDASGRDLTQFERWYTQAGTPRLKVDGKYFENGTYALSLSQSCPPTPNQPEKLPFHMPVKVGLIGSEDGKEIAESKVLELVDESKTFYFDNLPQAPIPSVLRGFSAPVKLEMEQTDSDLAFLLAHDTDEFNRWEAGQRLMTRVVLEAYSEAKGSGGGEVKLSEEFISALRAVLTAKNEDKQLQAFMLVLPDEATLSGYLETIDPSRLYHARKSVKAAISKALESEFRSVYNSLTEKQETTFSLTADAVGRRALRNLCLSYIISLKAPDSEDTAVDHYEKATCMTDKIAAVAELANVPGSAREKVLGSFLEDAKGDALVINKWFALQAMATGEDTLENVKKLQEHPEFTMKNPNRVRSLLGVYGNNMRAFHGEDGKGYEFLAGVITELDKLNPQIAARLLSPFGLWKRYDPKRSEMMKAQLDRVLATKDLSPDTFEVASRYVNA